MLTQSTRLIIGALAIATALAYTAVPIAALAADRADRITSYRSDGLPITFVIGGGSPAANGEDREVLRFADERGELVRVFARSPVGLAEARATLADCRAAELEPRR